jgi:PAS domain S-box-containing protein
MARTVSRGEKTSTRGVKSPRTFPWGLFLIFLLLAIITVIAGIVFQGTLQDNARRKAFNELTAIADLKTEQIKSWRQERLNDTLRAIESPFLTSSARSFIADPSQGSLEADLLVWMDSYKSLYDYKCLFLLDGNGRVILSSDEGEPLGSYAHDLALGAIATDETTFSDLHAGEAGNDIHIDLVAPIPQEEAGSLPAAGALVFRVDPYLYLYPLIQSWPTPSGSAETLLVRRDGDEVVFLNELRHQQDTALSLRFPAGDEELLAAMAVRGAEGVVEGVDYRGEKVLAAVQAIPGPPWFLVAKVDASEVYSSIRIRTWLVAGFTALIVLGLGLLLAFIWSRRQGLLYRQRYEFEAKRAALAQHYDYLTRYANDIIVLMDQDWNIVEANERAVQAYGYTREEFIGMPAYDLRSPAARPDFAATVDQLNTEKGTVLETEHMRKDGSVFPVEISARVIEVDGKKFCQGIIRDISERKMMEAELRSSEERYRLLFQRSPVGIFHMDTDLTVTDCNERFAEILGSSREKLIGLDANGLRDKDILPALRDTLNGREGIYEGVYRATYSSAEPYLTMHAAPLTDRDGEIVGIVAIVEDITDRKRTEEALRESEEQLRTIADASADFIMMLDGDLRVRFINRTEPGIDPDTVVGTLLYDIVDPEERAGVKEKLEAAARGGGRQEYETVNHRPDGTDAYFSSLAVPLMSGDEVIGVVVNSRDITERKKTEEDLERRRRFLFSVFEMIPATICLQAPDYSIRFANRFFRETFGDPEGRACYELLHSRSEPCEDCLPFRVFETGEPFTREWTSLTGRYSMISYSPFEDEDGTMLILEMGVDITQRKLVEQRLEMLNHCFLELGTDPLENIATIVETGKEVLDAAQMHYSRIERGRFSILATIQGDRKFRSVENEEDLICYKALSEGLSKPIIVEDIRDHGYEHFLPGIEAEGLRSYLANPVRAGGKTVGILGMLRRRPGGFDRETVDLLGMLARAIAVEEERLAHEEELRDFIDIASHELRHPMTIIKGYASTLKYYLGRMDDTTREGVLEDIDKGVDRLERLVYQLLDTARIERRRLMVETKKADVRRLVEETVLEMRERIPTKDISLWVSTEVGSVKVDAEKIAQVLVILIENAANYSEDDSPVEVEVSRIEGDGLLFSVLDRGVGVPRAHSERVFERFYQVGEAVHHSVEGIGLGLYIAREIVEAHGGRIWHEPREGGGSIFRFTLP